MNNNIDIQLVKDNYARMGDEQLIHIATNDAAGMTPEAQQVIKDELKSRKLDNSLIKGVEVQNMPVEEIQYDKYYDVVRGLDCPTCGSSGTPLNATISSQATSFIILTHRRKKYHVGCPDCLDKANNNALMLTLVLGWWGIPWGPIWSIQAIYTNIMNKRTNRIDQPNEYLKQFTIAKVGQLEVHKANKQKLQEIIAG